MTALEQIRYIERLASQAWPAEITKQLGGWYLRATDGITRRANSVLPLADLDEILLPDAIKEVEQFYSRLKLPPRFQMTKASLPVNLDEVLAESGYQVEMQVYVQTAKIQLLTQQDSKWEVKIAPRPTSDWFRAYKAATGYDEKSMRVRRDIIRRILFDKGCAAVFSEDEIIGIGLGIICEEWLGLFSITTLEAFQRQGVALSISLALGRWAKSQGVKNVFLQVEQHNYTAQALYAKLGFDTAYHYWYRQRIDT